jgi:MFS family permease
VNLAVGVHDGSALWSTNFRLYFGARTSSLLGDAMLPVALSVGVLESGYGAAGVGYALGAWMAALALCMLFGGVLADRFTARRMMVLADLARLVIQAGMAVMFAVGVPSLWTIVILQFLSGVATAMFQPGVASLVPQIAADVQRANGVLRVAESLAGVLGPALAGVVISVTGPSTVFAVYAATYAVSAGCLLVLRLPSSGRRPVQSIPRELAEGWQAFRSRRWLWSVIALFGVYGCFVAGVSLPVGADMVVKQHGSGSLGIGMAAFGLGGAIGGALATRARSRRPIALGSVGWALFTLFPLLPALYPSVVALAVGWAVAGLGLAFWSVLWATTVQTQIPPDLLNRVYAYDVTGSLLSMAIGRSLAGPLTALLGQRPLMLLATALGLICSTLLLILPATRTPLSAPSPAPRAAPPVDEPCAAQYSSRSS